MNEPLLGVILFCFTLHPREVGFGSWIIDGLVFTTSMGGGVSLATSITLWAFFLLREFLFFECTNFNSQYWWFPMITSGIYLESPEKETKKNY